MRWLLLLALLPSVALAQGPRIVSGAGTFQSGPRILGEPAFAFELDALEQAEASRPGWPVTTTRASTRMCFTGTAWQTVPANTPCIGRYGLASFGRAVSYVPNSAIPAGYSYNSSAARIDVNSDGTMRFADTSRDIVGNITFGSFATAAAGEKWVVSCIARAVSGWRSAFRLRHNGAVFDLNACPAFLASPEWATYSCVTSSTGAGSANAMWAPGRDTAGRNTDVVDIASCSISPALFSGARLDCGATAGPGNCETAADFHTVSTAGLPVASGEVSVWVRPNWTLPDDNKYIFDTRNTGGGTNGIAAYVSTTGALCLTGWPHAAICGSALEWKRRFYLITVGWDGATARIWRDGELALEVVGGAPTAHGTVMTIGSRGSAADYTTRAHEFGGELRLVRFGDYTGTGRAGGVASSKRMVVTVGDSLTHGVGFSAVPYPAALAASLGSAFHVVNEGIGGFTTAQMLSAWSSVVRPEKYDVVVVLGGVNDILTGVGAATAYANLSTIYSQALSDGARVVAVTLLPFAANSSWTTERQTQAEALNAMIRETPGVIVVDAYAAMAQAGAPTRLRAAYDFGDGLHLNDAGAAALAALVAGAIQ